MNTISATVVYGVLAAVVGMSPLWAFRPPSDTAMGVSLAISEFPDNSTRDGVSVRKVPTDQPLEFTLTLTNGSVNHVDGILRTWLNDDWEVRNPETELALAMAPGQSASVTCVAVAKANVVPALYPVHATFAFMVDGKEVVLHPIAIFEAKGAVASLPPSKDTPFGGEGVSRLDTVTYRTAYAQKDSVVDLGRDYVGSDGAGGTLNIKGIFTRDEIPRTGFSVHPPWRTGAGVAWNDFALALPKTTPIALSFYTAIRDSYPEETSVSDGVEFKVFVTGEDGKEAELFSRFSAAKTWEAANVDLGAYSGQCVTLRLWTGPGPHNDTKCDQAFWGDPTLVVGTRSTPPTEAQWQALEEKAIAHAKKVATMTDEGHAPSQFRLTVNGQVFGAAFILGEQGLTDGVIAFSDGERSLTYRGFLCDIDGAGIGAVENGRPVQRVDVTREGDAWVVLHHLEDGQVAQARIDVEGCALRIKWDLSITLPKSPRFTRLALGPCNERVWRAYAGFGSVVENPGAFALQAGGFSLSTRHVGADYPNGLSLVQATDVFPDQAVHVPATRRFGLETPHNATFLLIPSAKGAFDAARAYRDISGFQRGRGMDAIEGRMCIDQWDGDYRGATKGLREAGRYGVTNAVFVKHVWQRWGYDVRLPEIYPPRDGLDAFLEMRNAAKDAGMLFCPHDNYIDFYPDAENFSYDSICFTEGGQPVRAWYNSWAFAQSYRWLPHAFRSAMEANMLKMRDGFHPDSLFIDVFTAIAPFDYYDRAGHFYSRLRTAKEWADAFDICRSILGPDAPMISEAGHDALMGSVDAAQADHFTPARLFGSFSDAERTPWHDMATHGKMVLFAGGLGWRYSARDWNDRGDSRHGYGSDDYLSNTVMGGRNPMCDGPFSRRTFMTYWLLHDVCQALARAPFEAHEFGDTVHQQHTTFGGGCEVWVNRQGDSTWHARERRSPDRHNEDAGQETGAPGNPRQPLQCVMNPMHLPEYGFYVKTPEATAGIVLLDGRRAAFAKSHGAFFVDARPDQNQAGKLDFGGIVTDGAFRLVQDSETEWRLIPLPGSPAFTATLALDALGAGQHQVVTAVEMIDPINALTQPPEWAQDGDALTLACDGRSFAYRIELHQADL